MIKYFHELTKEEYEEILKQKLTWANAQELYPQPIWCSYPEAVCGDMGCWSLMDFRITGRVSCKRCEHYIKRSYTKKVKK